MTYYITDFREAADTNILYGATAINGATTIMDGLTPNTPKGFEIVGDGTKTGLNSEIELKRVISDQVFTGKNHTITAAIEITNYTKVGTNYEIIPRLRRYKDGSPTGDTDVFMTNKYTVIPSIVGTTMTRTYVMNYSLTNSDIINGYYYRIIFRYTRTTPIASGFTVAFTVTSLSMTTSLLQEVHIPDKNLKKNYELESNQQFFRIKLDGLVKLFDRDYDYVKDVIDVAFDTEFHFFIFNTVQYFHGTFMATDCEIDEDNKRLEISINSLDEYTDILNGYDKTFDVIKIDPAMTSVDIAARPVFQVYMPSENVLTALVGDTYFEEDTAKSLATYEGICVNNKFAPDTELITITLTTNLGSPIVDVLGKYFGYVNCFPPTGSVGYLYKAGEYSGNFTTRIRIERITESTSVGYEYYITNSSNVDIYNTDGRSPTMGFARDLYLQSLNSDKDIFFHEIGYSNNVIGTGTLRMVTTRVATNENPVLTNATFLRSTLTDGDIAMENLNYLRVVGAQLGIGRISSTLSSVPSRYGTNAASTPLYYQEPRAVTGKVYYPIFRESWLEDCSYWISYDSSVFQNIEDAASTVFTQKYCYTLAGVVNSFLQQVSSDITFEATSTYSEFFYDVVNPIATSLNNPEYLITPKSNILHGINAKPAQKAPLTFASLMNMIKNVFKCYWFVEDGKFRIEHIKYFDGGSYTASPTVFDLTALKNERSTKSWAFNTSNYKFDKELLPERIEFEYMDNCTEAFSGSPIESISKYVQKNKVDTVDISDFSADIDYILANAADIIEDGFVLLSKADGKVPFYSEVIKGYQVNLQNGLLSFPFIHKYYYLHDLPCKNVHINEGAVEASGILKKKEQEVKFPSDTDPNTNQLIKTYIGNGKIIKMSVNLASRIIEVTLAYDTE